jgi:hypothetical protein
MSEAVHALSMYFYTSNTPPERASNPHLRKAFALLGALVPEPRDIRGSLLDTATAKVKQSTLQALDGTRFAIITDGWSKRTAARGKPPINVMICPDDGPAVAWRIVDASGQIKDTAYVVQLHRDLRGEIEAAVPNGHFLGCHGQHGDQPCRHEDFATGGPHDLGASVRRTCAEQRDQTRSQELCVD